MIRAFSNRLSCYIVKELDNDRQQRVIAYGLEVIIGALIKIIAFVSLPLLFGVFKQTMAALITGASFRYSSGGSHCTSFFRCTLLSLVFFITFGLTAKHLSVYFPIGIIANTSVALSVIVAFLWAPAETKAKPIKNPKQKIYLKLISLATPILLLIITSLYNIPGDIILAGALGLLMQSFTVTPLGFHVTDIIDKKLITFENLLFKRKGGLRNET